MTSAYPIWMGTPDSPPPEFHAERDAGEPRSTQQGGVAFVQLADLLKQPDRDDVWVWQDRLRAGGVALLAGKPKAGKSAFARALAVAVATGSSFCGGATKIGTVWYLALEEHPDDVRRRFRRLVPDPSVDIRFVFGPVERGLLNRLREDAIRDRPVLIVVDTLQRLAQMADTNDYAQTTNAMNPILDLARSSDSAVLLLHHARKGEAADPQDGIMGSLGITASTDCNLVLSRGDSRRTLWSRQRIGPDLDETAIIFDETTGNISFGEGTASVVGPKVDERILIALAEASPLGLTENELLKVAGGKTVRLRQALRSLVGGPVIRTGTAERATPFVMVVPPLSPWGWNQGTRIHSCNPSDCNAAITNIFRRLNVRTGLVAYAEIRVRTD